MSFSSCLDNAENTGPDKPGTRHLITGQLFYANGKPVADAKVTIRPSNFLSDTSGALAKPASHTLTVRTDGNGTFSIDSIGMGNYVLEGRDKTDSVGMVKSVGIEGSQSSIMLIDTLKKPGTLRGKIALSEGEDPRKVFVLPFGINRIAMPDSNGDFELRGLPEATYDLRIMTPLDYKVMDISRVAVASGDSVDIGMRNLVFAGLASVKNVTAVCDSMTLNVTVSWDTPTGGKAAGYNVYRKHDDSDFIKINRLPLPGPRYIDSLANGIFPGDRYVYTAVSLDSLGTESERKHSVSIVANSAFHPVAIGIPPIPCAQGGCEFDVAPDQSLWLTNNAGTVLHYDSSGAVLGSWTIPVEPGMFGQDILADGDSGVYVLERSARVLEKFDLRGSSIWKLTLPFNRFALELHKEGGTLAIWGKEERSMAKVSDAGSLISFQEFPLNVNVANALEYSPGIGHYIVFGSEIWMVDSSGNIASKWILKSHGALERLVLSPAGYWILSWDTGLVEFYDPEKKLLANLVPEGQNFWDVLFERGKIYLLGIPYGDFRVFKAGFLLGL